MSQKSHAATVVNAKAAVITPKDSKTASWGTFNVGTCAFLNSSFTFNSDGIAYFTGQILANAPPPAANEVTLGGFGLHDPNGLELYRTASIPMGGPYGESNFDALVLFPAYMFSYIQTIVLYE